MKNIKVRHTPDFMNEVVISFVILWGLLVFFLCGAVKSYFVAVLVILVLWFAMIGFAIFLDKMKTAVEYDTEKVRWKWLWLAYTVDLNEMGSVYYTITSRRSRYGSTRLFEIRFNIGDSELKLNDILAAEDIENCINGKAEDIQLMQLYKFIENICPEKSKGFVKTS